MRDKAGDQRFSTERKVTVGRLLEEASLDRSVHRNDERYDTKIDMEIHYLYAQG